MRCIRNTILIGVAVALVGVVCLTQFKQRHSVPNDYLEAFSTTFNTTLGPSRTLTRALKEYPDIDLEKYTSVVCEGMSVIGTYVDKHHRDVEVRVIKQDNSYIATVTYDTPYETTDKIESIVKQMFGEDAVYSVSPHTVDGYTIVKVQGNEYRWKDGTLERVR